MFEAKKGDKNNSEVPALIKTEEYIKLAKKISEMKTDQAIESIDLWIKKHSLSSQPGFILNVLQKEISSCIEMREQELCEYQAEVWVGAKGNRYDNDGEYDFEFDFEDYAMSEGAVAGISAHLESLAKIEKKLEAISKLLNPEEAEKMSGLIPGRSPS